MFLTTPSTTWPSSRFCDDLRALLGAGLFEHGAARHDDVAAAAIHLEDLEGLRLVHQRGDVADRADVDLAARQERHGAVEVDGEAALDLVEDDAFDALALWLTLLEPDPALLAAGLLAREHGFAERVLDALDIDLDLSPTLSVGLPAGAGEFLQRHAAFGLQADVDDGHVLFDGDDDALDDRAFDRHRPSVKDSSSSAAKSSRDGIELADIVLLEGPAARRRRLVLRCVCLAAFRLSGLRALRSRRPARTGDGSVVQCWFRAAHDRRTEIRWPCRVPAIMRERLRRLPGRSRLR